MAEWAANFSDLFYKCFIREDRYKLLLSGIGVTIKVSLLAVIIGIMIGMLIAMSNLSKKKILRFVGGVYTDVIRGTPAVTQLMIIYFVIFASLQLDKWIIAAIAFGINSGAYVAEIVRSGIMSIDLGQTEAGRSLGLNYAQTMRYIVIPQAVKNILPALGNELITLLKETSVCGFIGLTDLTKGAMIVQSRTYSPFVPYIAIAVLYLIMVLALTSLLGLLERRLRTSDRR